MNRDNVMLLVISVCALSVFTFMYIYYDTKNKPSYKKNENMTIISAAATTPTTMPNKENYNYHKGLENQFATALEQHDQLLAENKSLINQLTMLNDGNPVNKTYFISTLNEKSFKSAKQEIACLKKEASMLKRENNVIRKEIKNLQKKK